MRQQSESAHGVMPGVHRVASLLQRWLLGTHQGRVSREHLDAYLNEFTFRFNRRWSPLTRSTYHSLVVNPTPTGRRSPLPSRPGRVATVAAVHRPWPQNAGNAGLPDSNGNPSRE
jgi:hypothetical protein